MFLFQSQVVGVSFLTLSSVGTSGERERERERERKGRRNMFEFYVSHKCIIVFANESRWFKF